MKKLCMTLGLLGVTVVSGLQASQSTEAQAMEYSLETSRATVQQYFDRMDKEGKKKIIVVGAGRGDVDWYGNTVDYREIYGQRADDILLIDKDPKFRPDVCNKEDNFRDLPPLFIGRVCDILILENLDSHPKDGEPVDIEWRNWEAITNLLAVAKRVVMPRAGRFMTETPSILKEQAEKAKTASELQGSIEKAVAAGNMASADGRSYIRHLKQQLQGLGYIWPHVQEELDVYNSSIAQVGELPSGQKTQVQGPVFIYRDPVSRGIKHIVMPRWGLYIVENFEDLSNVTHPRSEAYEELYGNFGRIS